MPPHPLDGLRAISPANGGRGQSPQPYPRGLAQHLRRARGQTFPAPDLIVKIAKCLTGLNLMPNLLLFIEPDKKLVARRQIDAAIEHLHNTGYECAITLAAAAEGTLPTTDEPHIFLYLKQQPEFKNKSIDVNEMINWLKHDIAPQSRIIYQYDAALIIFRAMSKFVAVFKEAPSEWDEFLEWGVRVGHWPDLPSKSW